MEFFDFLNNTFFWGNNLGMYVLSLLSLFILFYSLRFLRKVIIFKINTFLLKTKNGYDDIFVEILKSVPRIFYWFVSLYLSLSILNLSIGLNRVLGVALTLAVVYQAVIFVNVLVGFFIANFVKKLKKTDPKRKAFLAVSKLVKIIVFVLALLFLLSVFGVNITALVAGLGVGGIAIAFAAKEILSDLFSYFTILFDEPIEVGDYIKVGGTAGSVKRIGIKTTKLLGTDGKEVVISNTKLTSGIIDNSGRRDYRRVKFVLGVAYNTPSKKLRRIKKALEKIISSKEDTEFSRSHFKSFGESSLDFSVDYKYFGKGYNNYANNNEEINFDILAFFEKEGIEIAYPTKTVYNK